MDAKDIENNLKGVPPLTTLRQGIVVLSRQWKNALYTPILIEYNLRSRGLKNLYSAQVRSLLCQRFRLKIEIIIFESLLGPFEASVIQYFEAAGTAVKIVYSLKPNRHTQI